MHTHFHRGRTAALVPPASGPARHGPRNPAYRGHADLIQPYFVVESDPDFRKPIASMPGQFQLGLDNLERWSERTVEAGLKSLYPLRHSGGKRSGRVPGLCRKRHRAAGHPQAEGSAGRS
jgi:hypothetical protein